MEAAEPESKYQTLTAILIALVVVLGAIVAWRASKTDDAAGDADYAGLRALVNAEETRAINDVNAYEAYGNYMLYWRATRLSELLEADLDDADPQLVDALQVQYTNAVNQADFASQSFPMRFLNRDGSYALQRQVGELWADAAKEKDMQFAAQFAEADVMRQKTRRLLIAFMVLSIALIFYSLVESVDRRGQVAMLAVGTLFMLAGTLLAAMVEFNLL